SSLAMGNVTLSMPVEMDVPRSSLPKGVWATGSSSCWTFSKMNTCQSGEKRMRLHLKLGSKFRSIVRKSRPSSTSWDLVFHPDSRRLCPARNNGLFLHIFQNS
ncbi:hypothetical protein ILYODFUR_034238, partial [Ilyodon furcidens]